MGTTEFLTTMMIKPERAEALLKKITVYLKDWLHLQMETLPSIDGVFLLDDIIGFMGEAEFRTFGLPFLKELYDTNVSVKFLHNDAPCRVSARFLAEMGVNLFNMGFDISLNELKQLTQNRVALLGNIPPRDVLASGNASDVTKTTIELLDSLDDKSRIILSCGGGMPPGVQSENILAFIQAVRGYSGV
jgi:uroporphyrinogen decarboxylase